MRNRKECVVIGVSGLIALGCLASKAFADVQRCDAQELYANGQTLRQGRTYYYPNGQVILRDAEMIRYPSGATLRNGDSTYYPDGHVLQSGLHDLYYPNGVVMRSWNGQSFDFYYASGAPFVRAGKVYDLQGNPVIGDGETTAPIPAVDGQLPNASYGRIVADSAQGVVLVDVTLDQLVPGTGDLSPTSSAAQPLTYPSVTVQWPDMNYRPFYSIAVPTGFDGQQAFIDTSGYETTCQLRTGASYSTATELPAGPISGSVVNGLATYLGIPYAQPPVGDLRWAPPKPVAPFTTPYQATAFKSPCAQMTLLAGPQASWPMTLPPPGTGPQPVFEGAEDCLYLNIAGPQNPKPGSLPVIVFIYGGGDQYGSATDNPFKDHDEAGTPVPAYHPSYGLAASQKVVVVTFNYRVGVLGFLAHPGFAGSSPLGQTGNYGMLDQIAALQWVQNNISAFGGDPKRVTIFGQSAGGEDICALLVTPSAAGLFSGAIMASGHCGKGPFAPMADAQSFAVQLASDLGCSQSSASCLRGIDAQTLLTTPAVTALSGDETAWGKVMPAYGDLIPDLPLTLLRSGQGAAVPVMIGSTADEASLALIGKTDREALNTLTDWTTHLGAPSAARDLVPVFGLGHRALVAEGSALFQSCMVPHIASALAARQGAPVYRYYLSRVLPGLGNALEGAFHGEDLLYVFGNLTLHPILATPGARDLALSTQIQDYFIRFATTGDPSPAAPAADEPAWPRYDAVTQASLVFGPVANQVEGMIEAQACDAVNREVDYTAQ